MCVKYVFLVLLYILVNPEQTAAHEIKESLIQQFIGDFIIRDLTDNATDKCETTAEKYNINEDFNSQFSKKLQLQKYFTDDSKCENLCLNVTYYTIEENNADDVTTIIPTESASKQPASTESASKQNASTESASKEPTSSESANTKSANNTGANNTDATITVRSGGTVENVESNKNLDDSKSEKQTQDNSGEKRTAIIVSATIMAVGTVAVSFQFIVKGVKKLLQSGTYVFPGTPNV